MLDERKALVLRALVECYIRTGEPVSSGAVLDFSGLQVSSATIRNDLSSLEAEGYVVQPHTSAGRIPAPQAYRYYVDHLDPTKLRGRSMSRIHQFFGGVHIELGRLLKETSEMLADVSQYPAVVVGPGLRGELLRGVHLVQLAPQSALVILVTDVGRVSQELVRFDRAVDPDDVDEAEAVLTSGLQGRFLSEIDQLCALLAEDLPDPISTIVRGALATDHPVDDGARELYLGGTNQMAALWDDLAKVQQILELMSREARLLGMLAGASVGTRIQIGDEAEATDAIDVAVVSTDYDAGAGAAGRVGVIGPMRMDYGRTISIVEEVGEGLSERLGSQS